MLQDNLFMPYANNKGTDQPAHLCSLISTFVVPTLDSTRKGPAQAWVSTDIFHDGLRKETCSDTHIILVQMHSVHFANILWDIYAAEWF